MHQEKWELSKLGYEDNVTITKEKMDLVIKKAFDLAIMFLGETYRVMRDQVLLKVCHTSRWKNVKSNEQSQL